MSLARFFPMAGICAWCAAWERSWKFMSFSSKAENVCWRGIS
jgi:hypothetical protein